MDVDVEDVIQIYPGHGCLAGCYAVVVEVVGPLVLAEVPVSSVGIAPVRLSPHEYVVIGRARWVRTMRPPSPGEVDEGRDDGDQNREHVDVDAESAERRQ